MKPEERSESPSDIDEMSAEAEPAESAVDQVGARLTSGLNRRTFLAAAALGTAAANLLKVSSGGISLGPAIAGAQSTPTPCTAGDIDVSGGTAINEPCTCSGTFTPTFEFLVSNQNNANRTCITLILGTSSDASCSFLSGARLLLKVSPGQPGAGNSFLSGFAANVRMQGTPVDSSSNPIQIPCNFTQCCFTQSIVAFRTSQNQRDVTCDVPLSLGGFPSGQCRKQTICLTGFGVTVACANSGCTSTGTATSAQTCASAPTCTVPCGQDLRLVATAVGGTASCALTTPPTVTLSGPGITTPLTPTSQSISTANGIATRTACFTVPTASVQSGCYTVTATDCAGSCTRTALINVAVQQITTPTLTKKTANLCTGVATLTVAPCPPAVGVTYTLQQVDCTTGQPLPTPTITNVSFDASTCTFTVTLPQGQTTCLRVLASNGNPACDVFSNVVSVAVPPALSLALALTANPCSGLAVVTATATGGTAPFSFSFSGAAGTTLGNTFTISPQIVTGGGINTACQMLTGTVTDANGCTATNAITFSQCLSTTPGCTP